MQFVLVQGSEEILDASDERCDELLKRLNQLLNNISGMHFVLVSKLALGLQGVGLQARTCSYLCLMIRCPPMVFIDLDREQMQLKPLDKESGIQIIKDRCPDVKIADATTIADTFNNNPLILFMIADALRDGRMDINDAKEAPNLAELYPNMAPVCVFFARNLEPRALLASESSMQNLLFLLLLLFRGLRKWSTVFQSPLDVWTRSSGAL